MTINKKMFRKLRKEHKKAWDELIRFENAIVERYGNALLKNLTEDERKQYLALIKKCEATC